MSNTERFINLNRIDWNEDKSDVCGFHINIPTQCRVEAKNLERYLEYLYLTTRVETEYVSGPYQHSCLLNKLIHCYSKDDVVYITNSGQYLKQVTALNIDDLFRDAFIKALSILLNRIKKAIINERYSVFILYKINLIINEDSRLENIKFDASYGYYAE